MIMLGTVLWKSNSLSCNKFCQGIGSNVITFTFCLNEQINDYRNISWSRIYVAVRRFSSHTHIVTKYAMTSQNLNNLVYLKLDIS